MQSKFFGTFKNRASSSRKFPDPRAVRNKKFTVWSTREKSEREYTVKHTLGVGAFGTVYKVKDHLRNDEYALKVVELNHRALSTSERVTLMQLVNNEVATLKELKVLEGFKKNQNQALILLPLIPGKTADIRLNEINSPWRNQNSENAIKSCFFALRALHDRNIAHMDAHMGNFIVDKGYKSAYPIDFGTAQRKTLGNQMYDFVRFYESFKIEGRKIGPEFELSLIKYYAEYTLKYMRENKMKTAFNFFTYGALSIAVLYGLAVHTAALTIAEMLFYSLTTHYTLTYNIGAIKREHVSLLAQKLGLGEANKDEMALLYLRHIAFTVISLGMLYCLYSAPLEVADTLINLLNQHSVFDAAFWQAAYQTFDFIDFNLLFLSYSAATASYELLKVSLSHFILTEDGLAKSCDAMTQNKGLFQQFKEYCRPSQSDSSENHSNQRHTPKVSIV